MAPVEPGPHETEERWSKKKNLREFHLEWPDLIDVRAFARSSFVPWSWGTTGSTHEFTFNVKDGPLADLWVTAPAHNAIARVSTKDGTAKFFKFPSGSYPHGIVFDSTGNLWVSLEGTGRIALFNTRIERIIRSIDVNMYIDKLKLNPHPHGLGIDPDGSTLWFTGKKTGTVGRVDTKNATVQHIDLPSTVGSLPIYIVAGPDGAMWCTELGANIVARISMSADNNPVVDEFTLPTPDSRPIALVAGPDGQSMWVSTEAGAKISRIDMQGNVTEFAVPLTQKNILVASLAFDKDGNLWTQTYVNPSSPDPEGSDSIVRFDKSIQKALDGDLSNIPVIYYEVPSQNTIMHRIKQGPDSNIWFTELALDNIGRLTLGD